MNDSHSGIPLEADDSDSSDLDPCEAEEDVMREESNIHVPLQAGLPWFAWFWGVYGCIIFTFVFRLVLGLMTLLLGWRKSSDSLLSGSGASGRKLWRHGRPIYTTILLFSIIIMIIIMMIIIIVIIIIYILL